MTIGTLLKGRGGGKTFIIVKEIEISQETRNITKKIKGYRVSPCDRMDWAFAVNHVQLLQRFEVIG